MAQKPWKAAAPQATSSVTEVARLYHASALALGKSLGLSVQEVLDRYRECAAAVFIECCKREVRLPAGVRLPPLAGAVAQTHGQPAAAEGRQEKLPENPVFSGPPAADGQGDQKSNADVQPLIDAPTTVPVGLPLAGKAIPQLTPAQLAMLVAKVARLVQDGDTGLVRLLHALEQERQRRIEAGRRPRPTLVTGEG